MFFVLAVGIIDTSVRLVKIARGHAVNGLKDITIGNLYQGARIPFPAKQVSLISKEHVIRIFQGFAGCESLPLWIGLSNIKSTGPSRPLYASAVINVNNNFDSGCPSDVRNYNFALSVDIPSPLSNSWRRKFNGQSCSLYRSGVSHLLPHGAPLESSEHGIKNPGERDYNSKNSNHSTGMLGIYYKMPPLLYKVHALLRWFMLVSAVIGIVLLIYGVMLCQLSLGGWGGL
jgi:hypothetical protein